MFYNLLPLGYFELKRLLCKPESMVLRKKPRLHWCMLKEAQSVEDILFDGQQRIVLPSSDDRRFLTGDSPNDFYDC